MAALMLLNQYGMKGLEDDVNYMLGAIISLAFSIAIFSLLCVHTIMLMKNMSTIEMASLLTNNPFAQPNWKENIALVFGYDWRTYLLPVEPKDRPCDGINYSMKPALD
jgi:hypothetical protein